MWNVRLYIFFCFPHIQKIEMINFLFRIWWPLNYLSQIGCVLLFFLFFFFVVSFSHLTFTVIHFISSKRNIVWLRVKRHTVERNICNNTRKWNMRIKEACVAWETANLVDWSRNWNVTRESCASWTEKKINILLCLAIVIMLVLCYYYFLLIFFSCLFYDHHCRIYTKQFKMCIWEEYDNEFFMHGIYYLYIMMCGTVVHT